MADSYRVISRSPVVMHVGPKTITERRMDADYYRPQFLENQERLKNSEQQLMELKCLWSEGKYGILPPSSDYTDRGIVLIRGGDFQDLGVVDDENLVRVPAHYWEDNPKARAKASEILLLAKGATIDGPNSVALCPPRFDKALVNGSIFRIRPKQSVDAAYLAAYMATPVFLLQKHRAISNIGIFYNDLESIGSFLVPLPPRPVQEYIGAKVRLAERCRTRARELWEASEQLLSEALGMPLGTEHLERIDQAELRSDSYQLASANPVVTWVQSDIVERELGPHYFHPRRANVILKLRSSGVELKRLADLAERRNERVRADKVSQVPYYVGLADIDSMTGYFEPISPKEAGISGTSALFKSGDILFSKLRPYLNKVSICPAHVKQACGSTELLVYRANQSVLSYYVFFAIKSNVGLYQIIDVTAGSTLPRVDPEIVDDILVPLIPVEHQQTIDASICQAFALRHRATQLVREAKADVEALIEGQLDAEGIVAGRVQPPRWEDLEV